MKVTLSAQTAPSGARTVKLIMQNGVYYEIAATYQSNGLSEQALAETAAQCQALLYAVADHIIDASADANH